MFSTPCFARSAAVARSDEDLLHARALRETPGDRVLAPPDPMTSSFMSGA